MVKHPIYVPRINYRGADAKKRAKTNEANMAAQRIEAAANALLLKQTEPIRSYLWMEISQASGCSYDVVEKLGYGIDGGSGGFTAIRHDLTYEQAMAMIQRGSADKSA